MKKILLLVTTLTALVVFNANIVASPLNPKGIPADARGIIHIDMDLFTKTELGKTLISLSEKQLLLKGKNQAEYAEFIKLTGINFSTDISGITIGLFKDTGVEKSSTGVAVVNGRFSPEKLIAAAKQEDCRITTQDKLTVIEYIPKTDKAADGSGARGMNIKAMSVCIVDNRTLLVAEKASMLTPAISAITGKTASYIPPASLNVFGSQAGVPLVLAYVSRELTPETGNGAPFSISKAENFHVTIAEAAENLRTRVFSEYATAEAARKMQGTLQTLLGLAQMGLGQTNASDDPEAAERAAALQLLLNGFKMSVNDKALTVTVDYPETQLVESLKKYAAQQDADSDTE